MATRLLKKVSTNFASVLQVFFTEQKSVIIVIKPFKNVSPSIIFDAAFHRSVMYAYVQCKAHVPSKFYFFHFCSSEASEILFGEKSLLHHYKLFSSVTCFLVFFSRLIPLGVTTASPASTSTLPSASSFSTPAAFMSSRTVFIISVTCFLDETKRKSDVIIVPILYHFVIVHELRDA